MANKYFFKILVDPVEIIANSLDEAYDYFNDKTFAELQKNWDFKYFMTEDKYGNIIDIEE